MDRRLAEECKDFARRDWKRGTRCLSTRFWGVSKTWGGEECDTLPARAITLVARSMELIDKRLVLGEKKGAGGCSSLPLWSTAYHTWARHAAPMFVCQPSPFRTEMVHSKRWGAVGGATEAHRNPPSANTE